MRMAHPGCENDCGGYGYNSSGKYINGWAGKCGDGGRQNASWFYFHSSATLTSFSA